MSRFLSSFTRNLADIFEASGIRGYPVSTKNMKVIVLSTAFTTRYFWIRTSSITPSWFVTRLYGLHLGSGFEVWEPHYHVLPVCSFVGAKVLCIVISERVSWRRDLSTQWMQQWRRSPTWTSSGSWTKWVDCLLDHGCREEDVERFAVRVVRRCSAPWQLSTESGRNWLVFRLISSNP